MTIRTRLSAALTVAALLGLLVLGTSSASAVYRHIGPYANFGSDGTSATSIPSVEALAYQQSAKRLYVLSKASPRKLHGFSAGSPGSFTPLGGAFPLTLNDGAGDPDIAVDNTAGSSANNIYYAPDGSLINGFSSAGTPLPGFPVDSGSEVCGTAVDNEGYLWVGNYGAESFEKYDRSGGTALAKFPDGHQGRPCRLTVDLSNNDVYLSMYDTGSIWRYTAASGYSSASAVEFLGGGGNARVAINPLLHRLYAATNKVRVFDTLSGSLIEEFGSGSYRGIAIDNSTDTVFLANGEISGKVEEWRGGEVPIVTTGEPTGNSTVSGEVSTDGAGVVVECYFEFGLTTSYGSKEVCSPDTPYSSDRSVSADLPDLVGGTTYHYRLVAENANGANFGDDMTIVPTNVEELKTLEATNVLRTTATLRGSFNGNGQSTHYYFEWGPTTEYGSQSALPPYSDAGSPVGPTSVSFVAADLDAGAVYHYRVIAENTYGISYGEDRTFTTPPPVQSLSTEAATEVGRQGATLNGFYQGDGDATTYYYEYGITTGYGSSTPVQSPGSPTGPTWLPTSIGGLVVDTTYHYRVVATNDLGTSKGTDRTITTKSAILDLTTKTATDISQQNVTLNGEFNGTGDDTHYYFEWGPTTAYGNVTAAPPGEEAGSPVGATPLSAVISDFKGFFTYHYRVVASNELGVTLGNDRTFSTLPSPPPAVGLASVSRVTPSSAVFAARIAPNQSPTKFRFEYGPTAGYGQSTGAQAVPGWGSNEESVSATAVDLMPGTTYHYRVVASSLGGTVTSTDRTFSTPGRPVISRVDAGAIGQSVAQLAATVSSSSLATAVRFEYGTSRAYGKSSGPLPVAAGPTGLPVAIRLDGLSPGTTYHFRAVAGNDLGAATSTDRTFTTLPGKTGRKAPKKCKKGKVRKRGKCVKGKGIGRRPSR